MRIIVATESLVPQIVEVWKEFMDYHKNIDPHLARREDGHVNFENYLRNLMKSEDAQLVVALDKDRVVGYCLALINKNPPVVKREIYGYISDIAVQSDYRRQGIGGANTGQNP